MCDCQPGVHEWRLQRTNHGLKAHATKMDEVIQNVKKFNKLPQNRRVLYCQLTGWAMQWSPLAIRRHLDRFRSVQHTVLHGASQQTDTFQTLVISLMLTRQDYGTSALARIVTWYVDSRRCWIRLRNRRIISVDPTTSPTRVSLSRRLRVPDSIQNVQKDDFYARRLYRQALLSAESAY